MELTTRRWVARLVRVGLVLVAIAFVGIWIGHRVPHPSPNLRVTRSVPSASALGPGDIRIYSRDSAIDVVLAGDRILSGLSPKIVDQVRTKMAAEQSKAGDSNGFGAMISQQVRSAVADNIGMHVMYPLSEVRDVRYEDGQIILDRVHGGETRLFGNTTVRESSNGSSHDARFNEDEAQRFIEAVRARKAQLGIP